MVQNWWVSWTGKKSPSSKKNFLKRQRQGGGWQGNSVCKSACHHAEFHPCYSHGGEPTLSYCPHVCCGKYMQVKKKDSIKTAALMN